MKECKIVVGKMAYSHLTVGVLDLQGAVSEHMQQIRALGATAIAVKHPEQLAQLDGLVLPGGESTAMGKLMRYEQFIAAIRQFSQQNKGIFGTCAGMILLAKALENHEPAHLKLMDICVQRNAFGRQVDSFQTDLHIKGIATPFPAVFIRAPYITQVLSPQVEVLAKFKENIVLAKQDKLLVASFHPELTDNPAVMRLFLDLL